MTPPLSIGLVRPMYARKTTRKIGKCPEKDKYQDEERRRHTTIGKKKLGERERERL